MYRFLDKRFYHRGRWEFDLQTFACEHIGLSKNYSNSELKRKLLPAVRELEGRGFLTPLPEAERFRQVERGSWRAVFVKAQPHPRGSPSEEAGGDTLVRELVARGITRRSAQKLLARHPRGKVEEKIRLYDRLKAGGGGGAIRNRAGWLYAAIVNDYAVPPEATPTRTSRGEGSATAAAGVATAPDATVARDAPDDETLAFESFWAALAAVEQEEFERQAVAEASPFHQKQYHAGLVGRGTLWAVTRRRVLQHHLARTRATAVGLGSGSRGSSQGLTATHTPANSTEDTLTPPEE